MARRQGYIAEFAKRYPQVPHLHIDAGHLFGERLDFSSKVLSEDIVLGNEWVIRALDPMRVAAANVSFQDLPQLDLSFSPQTYPSLVQTYPAVRGLISANIRPIKEGYPKLEPFTIREITGPRLPKPLRVGIVGFTERGRLQLAPKNFTVDDPFPAARKLVPRIRPKCDLLIALAYMPKPMASRLAQENPGIDIVLNANEYVLPGPPESFGKTKLLQCINEGKILGELRIYLDEKGRVRETTDRSISLDGAIPDDRLLAEIRENARKQLSAVQDRLARVQAAQLGAENPILGTTAPGSGRRVFAGAGTCQSCHEREYQIWEESAHAHAFATLQRVRRENEQDCISCHVTGFEEPTGYVNIFTTPRMKDVQCESCHTAGSNHINNPVLPYGKVKMPDNCITCHNPENDPDFNLEAYWAKIKH
ncbi:MAG: hypothetical protein HY650_15905 [Acidobacteria bacterium]|nr:hypothetical protein [Acidobacteriota bacterium]